jgi:probable H4MPT-linked C1 transfer pathway protein
MRWLALDIGGANIKVADGEEFAVTQPFALWRYPAELPQFLRRLIVESPGCERLAITMTGELADCFETKAAGVQSILAAVQEAADGRHTRVYLRDGRLVTLQVAQRWPELVAAANWHALASYVGRFAPVGASILLDIGSTTTDIIPLHDGVPTPQGSTDTQRLTTGELYYSGVQRNPLCGVAQTAAYRGSEIPLAQEYFSTIGDVYTILGDLPEAPTNNETADGRPVTKRHARARLSRMVCADADEFNHRDAVNLAQSIANHQQSQITRRLDQVANHLRGPLRKIITSGVGEFVARRIAAARFPDVNDASSPVVSLKRELSLAASIAAPAHALAVLAREAGPR